MGSVVGRHLEHGECAHHRSPLALVDETELCAQFDVTHPVGCGTTARPRVGHGRDHVKLQAGPDAVVHLHVRCGSRRQVAGDEVLGCQIELPVAELHRLRVIRHIGRTGVPSCRQKYNGEHRN